MKILSGEITLIGLGNYLGDKEGTLISAFQIGNEEIYEVLIPDNLSNFIESGAIASVLLDDSLMPIWRPHRIVGVKVDDKTYKVRDFSRDAIVSSIIPFFATGFTGPLAIVLAPYVVWRTINRISTFNSF